MSRLAGRTRIARKQLVIEASGLPLAPLVPCRHVTCRILPALAIASVRRFAGGAGQAGPGGRPGPPPRLRVAGRAPAACALVVPLTATTYRQPRFPSSSRKVVLSPYPASAVTAGRVPPAAVTCSRRPHPSGPAISSIISSASRHFSRCRMSPGMRACSRRRRTRAAATGSSSALSSQLCGQNSRQSAAHEARSFTRCTLTPTWQLPVLPSVPEYCRATHGDASPSFGKPVSSTTSAPAGCAAANHRATFRRTAA